jgi:hypothetical protein
MCPSIVFFLTVLLLLLLLLLSPYATDALAAYQEAQQAAKSSDKSERTSLLSSLAAAGPASQRVPSLAPLQPRDSQALSRMVTQYRYGVRREVEGRQSPSHIHRMQLQQ